MAIPIIRPNPDPVRSAIDHMRSDLYDIREILRKAASLPDGCDAQRAAFEKAGGTAFAVAQAIMIAMRITGCLKPGEAGGPPPEETLVVEAQA